MKNHEVEGEDEYEASNKQKDKPRIIETSFVFQGGRMWEQVYTQDGICRFVAPAVAPKVRYLLLMSPRIRLLGAKPRGEDYIFKMRHHELSNSLNRIKKKLNLPELYIHLFRKCRSTDLSNYMTQQQLCKYLGWVPDSRMPRHYIFLSNDDANNAILKMHQMRMTPVQRL